MKQKIKAMLEEKRGVSPVIGVILMVAITVILAAVIGTFVLGLGDSLNQTPQAQLNADSGQTNFVNVSHSGGDPLPYSEITFQLNGTDVSDSEINGKSGSELSVGNSIGMDASVVLTDYNSGNPVQLTIVHDPSQSILLDVEVDTQG